MKNSLIVVPALLALALAGCTTPPADPPAASSSTPSSALATDGPPMDADTDGPPPNDHGNYDMGLGEPATIAGPDGKPMVTMTVRRIGVDDMRCNSGFSARPANGHYVFAHITVKTTRALRAPEAEEIGIMGGTFWTDAWWEAYDAKGRVQNGVPTGGNASSCLDSADALPSEVGAGTTATGVLVFDVRSASGTLAYQDPNTGAAWEWAYGK